jgi:hypothetical protein
MSGELTLSQFKATTTQNNDFVIGNPVPYGSTDTSNRYLVFQVSDKVGPTHNPHVRCEYTGSAWRIKLSDNGVTDSDFAFLNTGTDLVPQNFTGVNTFNGVTNFIETVNTGTINLGYSSADKITFNGSPIFTGPLTFNSPVTFQSDVTIVAPTHDVNITANSFSAGTKTLLLNKGVNIGAGGLIGIEVADVTTPVGYIKTLSDNTGWQVKAPQNAGTVTFIPSLSASDLIIKPVNGDFGPGNVRTFEFLNGNGYVGGYNKIPAGDKIVVSTPTGFKESTITVTTLNFLSNVTSDIQSQLTTSNGIVFTLNSRVDSAESNLSIALATMATNQSTNASLISALDSRVTNAEATITSSLTTFASDLSAETAARLALSTTVAGHTASIASEITARSTADSAEAAARLALAASIPGIADARIATALSTYSDPTKASAQSVTDLTATVASNAATAHQELLSYVGPTGTVSSLITNLSTTVDGHSASISSQQSSINGLEAKWGVTIDNNGAISGISLNSGANQKSTFAILVDNFVLQDATTKLTPFTYSNGKLKLTSDVDITGTTTFYPGQVLNQLISDFSYSPSTTIDGDHITTGTIAASTIYLDNLSSKIYSTGTTLSSPVGFRLSATHFPTTFIGDSSPTPVLFELGGDANFGGYRVGNVTDKVFAAAATAYYINLGLTVEYPWSSTATSGMPFVEMLRSGVSVSYDTTTNINSFVAQAGGIYTIDIAFHVHGAALSSSYMHVYCAVKRTGSAYFSELIFHDWSFFCSGKSEPHVSSSVVVELFAGDKIAFFYTAPGMSYLNAYIVMTNTGPRAASDVLTITTPSTLYTRLLNGITPNLSLDASNAYGAVSWSLDGGTAAGVTIVNNSLKCPDSVGTYTCNLRVIDSKVPTPQQATKTTTVTVDNAAPLTVSNLSSINLTYGVSDIPVNASIFLTASGAIGAVTWTILSCDAPNGYNFTKNVLIFLNIDTACTITSVVKANTSVQGDSATATITTHISLTGSTSYVYCFGRGTLVLMNDGSSKPIETIVSGDLVKAISADSHQSGLSDVITATVNERVDGKGYIHKMVSVDGILSTASHPWAVLNPIQKSNIFWPAQALSREYYHRILTGKELKVGELQASIPIDAGTEEEVYTIYTTAGAYFVGASESGPWYLVHNLSIVTTTDMLTT